MKKNKKVFPVLTGGIGNQLFIYSAARCISYINNAELILDDLTGFKNDLTYFRKFQLNHFNIKARIANKSECLYPFRGIRKLFLNFLNKISIQKNLVFYQEKDISYNPNFVNKKFKKVFILEGYFQSEKYFSGIENIIRNDLKFIKPTDHVNLEWEKVILNQVNSVAIHIRFFESIENKSNSNLQLDYYDRAFEYINNVITNPHFFIFSDNYIQAKQIVHFWNCDYTIVTTKNNQDNAYADLWLMSLCNNFIIANSTFSWWGAWLSTNSSKIVIAPKEQKIKGVSKWGFDGLIPNQWIQI